MRNKALVRNEGVRLGIGLFSLVLAFICLLPGATGVALGQENDLLAIGERIDGGFYTLVDEVGKQITMTARYVVVGDSYIDADNRQYEVVAIDGDTVRTRYVGTVELPEVDESGWTPQTGGVTSSGTASSGITSGNITSIREVVSGWIGAVTGRSDEKATGGNRTVGIYHTHSDESYRPTSGVDSKNTGDIYKVGEVLASSLEKLGLNAVWSRNNHNPHDAGAYNRSRRTAVQLLKQRPTTLIDVHRDATPPELYEATINGKPITKVRLVVGRENPNSVANLEYAKRLKAVADKKFPGLILGIYNGAGDYNQDLGPRTILMEFGSHLNELERAENAASIFASVVPAAAGMTRASARPAGQQLGATGSWSALILAVIVGVLILGFLALNVGGFREFRRRLQQFFGRELLDVDVRNVDHEESRDKPEHGEGPGGEGTKNS